MLHAPIPVLLSLAVCTSFLLSILRGIYSKQRDMTGYYLWQFNFLQGIACLIGVTAIHLGSGSSFRFSWFSVGLGIALAACNVISLYSTLKAYSLGTFSYSSVIIALSAIIPTLCGLFLGETILPAQYIGVALMIVCILLSPDKKQDSNRSADGKWLFWCAVAFVSSGGVGVIQKIHQRSAHHAEMSALLIVGFALSALFAVGMLQHNKPQTVEKTKSVLWIPLISGACFAFPHTINLVLAGQLPAVIMFPIVNLCPMILSMLFAFTFMKERLSVTQWVGIAFGILSTVFVSGIISL